MTLQQSANGHVDTMLADSSKSRGQGSNSTTKTVSGSPPVHTQSAKGAWLTAGASSSNSRSHSRAPSRKGSGSSKDEEHRKGNVSARGRGGWSKVTRSNRKSPPRRQVNTGSGEETDKRRKAKSMQGSKNNSVSPSPRSMKRRLLRVRTSSQADEDDTEAAGANRWRNGKGQSKARKAPHTTTAAEARSKGERIWEEDVRKSARKAMQAENNRRLEFPNAKATREASRGSNAKYSRDFLLKQARKNRWLPPLITHHLSQLHILGNRKENLATIYKLENDVTLCSSCGLKLKKKPKLTEDSSPESSAGSPPAKPQLRIFLPPTYSTENIASEDHIPAPAPTMLTPRNQHPLLIDDDGHKPNTLHPSSSEPTLASNTTTDAKQLPMPIGSKQRTDSSARRGSNASMESSTSGHSSTLLDTLRAGYEHSDSSNGVGSPDSSDWFGSVGSPELANNPAAMLLAQTMENTSHIRARVDELEAENAQLKNVQQLILAQHAQNHDLIQKKHEAKLQWVQNHAKMTMDRQQDQITSLKAEVAKLKKALADKDPNKPEDEDAPEGEAKKPRLSMASPQTRMIRTISSQAKQLSRADMGAASPQASALVLQSVGQLLHCNEKKLKGYCVSLATTHAGSVFLQLKLQGGNKKVAALLYEELTANGEGTQSLTQLMLHLHGCSVISALFQQVSVGQLKCFVMLMAASVAAVVLCNPRGAKSMTVLVKAIASQCAEAREPQEAAEMHGKIITGLMSESHVQLSSVISESAQAVWLALLDATPAQTVGPLSEVVLKNFGHIMASESGSRVAMAVAAIANQPNSGLSEADVRAAESVAQRMASAM